MSPREQTNVAASVHQRLLNIAKATSRPFLELLQRYAIERFLFRFCNTRHVENFVLKGALMLTVWGQGYSRPTMDIDLMGLLGNNPASIAEAIKDACVAPVVGDGLIFDPASITYSRIAEDAHAVGVRLRVRGNLGNARVTLQVDIGFGDALVPGTSKVIFPALLDYPAPELIGYSRESTIAEKFQVMVMLGSLNSRMKDFYDVWLLCRHYDFSGATLAQAVRATFDLRHSSISAHPAVFERYFEQDPNKIRQWRGFIAKSRLDDAPVSFEDVVAVIKGFLGPVLAAIADKKPFRDHWNAPGPWKPIKEP